LGITLRSKEDSSADPIIQDPEHSQSYNRYTYVWNNPTNMTDPTGFEGETQDKRDQQIERDLARERAKNPYGDMLGHSSERGSSSSKDGSNGKGNTSAAASSATTGTTSWGSNVSNFFEQAMRSLGIFDGFIPSRESFESGASQFLGGPCFQLDCSKHDFHVKQTADVFQAAAHAVAETGNQYYPNLAKIAQRRPGGTSSGRT
jgi:hypothetical protein